MIQRRLLKKSGKREEESDESVRVVYRERERERESEVVSVQLRESTTLLLLHIIPLCASFNALYPPFLSSSSSSSSCSSSSRTNSPARTPCLRRVRLHRSFFLCRTTLKIPVLQFRRPTPRAIVVSIDQPPRQVAFSGRSNRFQRDFGR